MRSPHDREGAALNNLSPSRIPPAMGVLFLLVGACGCVVLPFGHDEGEHRGEHGERGERGSREHLNPAPRMLPSRDAGDDSEHERVVWPPRIEAQPHLPLSFQPAVYVRPAAPGAPIRVVG